MIAALPTLAALPASIPAPTWSGFGVGPLFIHAYALCILAGIIAATLLTNVRWNRRGAPEGSIWDIAIWAIPFGIIGGRLYHVVSSPDLYFGPGFDGTGDLSLIPQIWRGGLGIWGAIVLGVVGAWIGCRRAGVKLPAFLDAAAPGVLLAQALGRWGNYFNQELFGGPTTQPWGLEVDPTNANFPAGYPAGTLFHPTFLYESLWNLVGVAILLLLDRRFSLRRGRLFWLYAMYYTLGRVWIELLRIDDAEQITLFGITTRLNVWTSILVFVVATVVFLVLTFSRRSKDRTDSVLRRPEDGEATATNYELEDTDGHGRHAEDRAADGHADADRDADGDADADRAADGDADADRAADGDADTDRAADGGADTDRAADGGADAPHGGGKADHDRRHRVGSTLVGSSASTVHDVDKPSESIPAHNARGNLADSQADPDTSDGTAAAPEKNPRV